VDQAKKFVTPHPNRKRKNPLPKKKKKPKKPQNRKQPGKVPVTQVVEVGGSWSKVQRFPIGVRPYLKN
jgi:hypothetical protein